MTTIITVLSLILIAVGMTGTLLLLKYLMVVQNVKHSSIKLSELYRGYIESTDKYDKLTQEYKDVSERLNKLTKGYVVEVIEYPRAEADEKMELVYLQSPSGFHIGLDATYIDQVGDFEILLPTGEIIDTALL